MPVQTRRDGDSLLVDNVDLKRLARSLLQKMRTPGWRPPEDLNQCMELVAQGCGFPTLLAANLHASAAKGIAASIESPHVHDSAPSAPFTHARARGVALPLPWPRDGDDRSVFYSVVNGPFRPGEIAAIVGHRGTDKASVCDMLVAHMGGVTVDFGAGNWREQFDAARNEQANVIIIKRLYAHSAATEQEVLEFARSSLHSNIVFVFDEADSIQDLMSRKGSDGVGLFHKAHVLDTQFNAFSTLVSGRPPSERSRAQIEGTTHAKSSETVARTNSPEVKSLRRARP